MDSSYLPAVADGADGGGGAAESAAGSGGADVDCGRRCSGAGVDGYGLHLCNVGDPAAL